MHKKPDNFILRGDNCFLKTGNAEIDVTQVVNFIIQCERNRIKEIIEVSRSDAAALGEYSYAEGYDRTIKDIRNLLAKEKG